MRTRKQAVCVSSIEPIYKTDITSADLEKIANDSP